jgi:ssDNA-binding Zn-finger/Zn-ribbon topoisomerase 1
MRRRKAKAGKNAGKDFWGCAKYPECNGLREID